MHSQKTPCGRLVRMIRLLLVAHVRLVREQLAAALAERPQFQVVASTGDEATAIASAVMYQADVMLLDHALPHAIYLLRQMMDHCPKTRTLVIGVLDNEREVVAFAEAGMWGYTPPDATLDELAGAIERVARGESTYTRQMMTLLLRRVATRTVDRPPEGFPAVLTARERQVVALIDEGLSNREIADRLGVEVATVKNHVHNLLSKLRVKRRAEAAAHLRERAQRRTPPPGSLQRPA